MAVYKIRNTEKQFKKQTKNIETIKIITVHEQYIYFTGYTSTVIKFPGQMAKACFQIFLEGQQDQVQANFRGRMF